MDLTDFFEKGKVKPLHNENDLLVLDEVMVISENCNIKRAILKSGKQLVLIKSYLLPIERDQKLENKVVAEVCRLEQLNKINSPLIAKFIGAFYASYFEQFTVQIMVNSDFCNLSDILSVLKSNGSALLDKNQVFSIILKLLDTVKIIEQAGLSINSCNIFFDTLRKEFTFNPLMGKFVSIQKPNDIKASVLEIWNELDACAKIPANKIWRDSFLEKDIDEFLAIYEEFRRTNKFFVPDEVLHEIDRMRILDYDISSKEYNTLLDCMNFHLNSEYFSSCRSHNQIFIRGNK